jgi:hypothetical protein
LRENIHKILHFLHFHDENPSPLAAMAVRKMAAAMAAKRDFGYWQSWQQFRQWQQWQTLIFCHLREHYWRSWRKRMIWTVAAKIAKGQLAFGS